MLPCDLCGSSGTPIDYDPRVHVCNGCNETLIERFYGRVMPEPNSGCWLWDGADMTNGYGVMSLGRRRFKMLAHRFSYVLHKGKIAEGLELDHKCRVRGCVNPDHLEAVTHRTNVLRGVAPAAFHAQKTHCPRGHELSHPNLINRRNRTSRECKICHAVQERERKKRGRLVNAAM